jgi:hypothetical protein
MPALGRALRYGLVTTLVATLASLVGAGMLAVALDSGPEFRFALVLLVSVVTLTTVFAAVDHLVERRLAEDDPEPSPGTNPLSGADQP